MTSIGKRIPLVLSMMGPILCLRPNSIDHWRQSANATEPSTATADLLAQITTPFDAFIGDGAYDGEPVAAAVLSEQPQAKIIIPPHKTAVISEAGDTQRDRHIQDIAEKGRITWQRDEGAFLAPSENGGRDQRVCTESDDKSGDASLRESLKW
jgi:hypothetical protein